MNDIATKTKFDPVTLAVIENGLQQAATEYGAFVRAAFSPVISEALDRSDGIYHRSTRARRLRRASWACRCSSARCSSAPRPSSTGRRT